MSAQNQARIQRRRNRYEEQLVRAHQAVQGWTQALADLQATCTHPNGYNYENSEGTGFYCGDCGYKTVEAPHE